MPFTVGLNRLALVSVCPCRKCSVLGWPVGLYSIYHHPDILNHICPRRRQWVEDRVTSIDDKNYIGCSWFLRLHRKCLVLEVTGTSAHLSLFHYYPSVRVICVLDGEGGLDMGGYRPFAIMSECRWKTGHLSCCSDLPVATGTWRLAAGNWQRLSWATTLSQR